MLILLWIVSFFTAFFLTITLVYFLTLFQAKHPPFHQACELTVYVSFIYPLSLLVTAAFIFIMMLLFPLYWLRGR
ncbi:hypothetical protein [Bacillus pumilus]|uniref:hypothetical protein n=1 Tax=Bacillus pumilus TaxID=1408 RepID=UPI000D03F368|nr:hypothetical protein [Bacillus pumilus]PRS28301.1 hypothetical protein C6X99_11510 [Bacillus pumilus]